MGRVIDITGQVFGRLRVIALSAPGLNGSRWSCICSCGRTTTASACHLRSGATRSCGCLMRESGAARPKHLHSGTRTYRSWMSMRNRCFRITNDNYPQYGGRGVTVCPRWLGEHGFEHFLADMGERPPDMTIDRFPDRHGNYEPNNCRWATNFEQGSNRDTSKLEPHERSQIAWLVSLGYRQHDVARFFEISTSHVSRVSRGLHR